jgi:hypothetical protein
MYTFETLKKSDNLIIRLRLPGEKRSGQSASENIKDAASCFIPSILVELDAIADNEIFKTVGTRSSELLVVLLYAPKQLCVKLLEQ